MRKYKSLAMFVLLHSAIYNASAEVSYSFELSVGQSNVNFNKQSVPLPDSLVITHVEKKQTSFTGGIYIHPNEYVNLGFKYIDLGDGELIIEGESLDIITTQNTFKSLVPLLPKGLALQMGYNFIRVEGFSAKVFVGILDTKYDEYSALNNERPLKQKRGELLGYYGLGLRYVLNDYISLGLAFSHYKIKTNPVNDASLSLYWHF